LTPRGTLLRFGEFKEKGGVAQLVRAAES
jgi:hypothetical protein